MLMETIVGVEFLLLANPSEAHAIVDLSREQTRLSPDEL